MFKEYIYKVKLNSFQREAVKNFNESSKISYEEIKNCEVCYSKKFTEIFKNDRYNINQKTCICSNCGFMFLNPRMNDSSTKYFYNSDLYRLIYNGYGKDYNQETLFKNTLKELENYTPSLPKKPNFSQYYSNLYFDFINNEIEDFDTVLDVGCGKGKKIIDFNFIKKNASGIEPSISFNKVHKKIGLDTKVGFLKDVKKKYDLVILSHVFEHFTKLDQNVDYLYNITNKYLYIEVPGHVKNLQRIQNAHNYYFSMNTLNYFILNNKFRLIKMDYARDNEFILAVYEKTKIKSNFILDKKKEKKAITLILRKYKIKLIVTKTVKLLMLEKIMRKIYNFFLKKRL